MCWLTCSHNSDSKNEVWCIGQSFISDGMYDTHHHLPQLQSYQVYLLEILCIMFSKSLITSMSLMVLVYINEVRPIYLTFYHTKRAKVLNIGYDVIYNDIF